MYNILVEKNKNLFKMETKEELEKKVISFNEHCKDLSEKTNIKLFKTDSQGNIKAEIRLSLPEKKEDLDYYLEGFDEEKDEISHCLEKFCLEKEEANEEKEEAYKQEQETKLKNYNDNELDESDKDVYKNIINQDNEDITIEVTPSAKEKQKAIREQVEAKTKQEEKKEETQTKEEEKEQVNVQHQETTVKEEQQHQETKAKAEEIKEEKAEETETKQNQELLANSEKENIVYVPTNIKIAKSIVSGGFKTTLGEMQGERKKLEEIIEVYEQQILEYKKAEKQIKEILETL